MAGRKILHEKQGSGVIIVIETKSNRTRVESSTCNDCSGISACLVPLLIITGGDLASLTMYSRLGTLYLHWATAPAQP